MKPQVSVIVTCKNYRHFLDECLGSIRAQTFKDYELIIVDDGSTDNSADLALKYKPDALVVLPEGRGTMHASNLGVVVSSGKYCVLVNADDKVAPDFLQLQYDALSSAEDSTAFAYTDFWHFGHKPDGSIINNGVAFIDWNLEELKKWNYVLCSAMFKKDVFNKVGGFAVEYGMEDYDLWLRMGLAGHKGVHVPGYHYHYRAHSTNRTHHVDVGMAMERIKQAHIGTVEPKKPTFSLLYATRRSWHIESVIDTWLAKAEDPTDVEIIVAVDEDDDLSKAIVKAKVSDNVKYFVQNERPFNSVAAWNLAAKHSCGKVLVAISDDFIPPEKWDAQLADVEARTWMDKDAVVRVNDGNNAFTDKPFTLPILTRKRYERFGYVYWPEYHSMWSDREFADVAMAEGCVIDARTLLFEHIHQSCFKREEDAVDKRHSSKARWDHGKMIYATRAINKFPSHKVEIPTIAPKSLDDYVPTQLRPVVPAPTGSVPALWNQYVKSAYPIQSAHYAVSMEFSIWLSKFLEAVKPKSMLDMGPNFQSVVMAMHAKKCPDTKYVIAGADANLVSRHRDFMEKQGLSGGSYTTDISALKFDLIVVDHDSAESTERFNFITTVAPLLLNDGGFLVLDDAHYMRIQMAKDVLIAKGWKASAPRATMDQYDRFAYLLAHRTTIIPEV